MTILPGVVKAEYRGDYRIHLIFNDGTSKTVDFQPWLDGPVFEPLRDQRYFRDFFVAGSTVCWPNGADIAPETLYAATDYPPGGMTARSPHQAQNDSDGP